MKAKVIKEMTTEEVADKLTEEFETYRKLKMNHVVSPLENPLQLRFHRRTIARLKTELAGRESKAQSNN